jgi:hypothetical protein
MRSTTRLPADHLGLPASDVAPIALAYEQSGKALGSINNPAVPRRLLLARRVSIASPHRSLLAWGLILLESWYPFPSPAPPLRIMRNYMRQILSKHEATENP